MAFLFGENGMRLEAETSNTEPAQVRYGLKAKVIGEGYKTYIDVAGRLGIHRVYLSQVLNGHIWPSGALQRRIASELGLTLRELQELL
jgi:transcriptional regulator with XRE-family HTH domain